MRDRSEDDRAVRSAKSGWAGGDLHSPRSMRRRAPQRQPACARAGGFQVPAPAGRIDGGSVFGQ
jgi:hypothetical protein